jgi:hypothetical protein
MITTYDLIIVWWNNRPTLWRWDDGSEDFRYLRNLSEDERRLIESRHASAAIVDRSVASAERPFQPWRSLP